MRRMGSLAVVVGAVSLVVVNLAWAQQPPAPGPMGPGMGGPGMMQGRGPAMVRFSADQPLLSFMLTRQADLGLTADQVRELEALRAGFQREAEAKAADLRTAEQALGRVVEADRVDLARVEEQVEAIAQLQADLRLGRIRTVERGKALLTPEQVTKLKALTGPRS